MIFRVSEVELKSAVIHEGVSVTPMISYHLSEDDVVSEETFTRIPEKKVKAGRVL
jgi:hypothetical protein